VGILEENEEVTGWLRPIWGRGIEFTVGRLGREPSKKARRSGSLGDRDL